jgi:methylmalonyl-CoA epimerase
MVTGVEHIGIVVKDSDQATELMRAIFGAKVLETVFSQERGLKLTFLDAGGTRVELLEPLTKGGTVASFLETKGEGFHHIAFKVSDIEKALSVLRQAGVKLVEPAPQKGAHGNPMAFIHPSSACGILVELCERK